MGFKNANYNLQYDGMRIRVMCSKCEAGGVHYLSMNQPKCHICKDGTLMFPSSNTKIECSWDEARKYSKELERLWSV